MGSRLGSAARGAVTSLIESQYTDSALQRDWLGTPMKAKPEPVSVSGSTWPRRVRVTRSRGIGCDQPPARSCASETETMPAAETRTANGDEAAAWTGVATGTSMVSATRTRAQAKTRHIWMTHYPSRSASSCARADNSSANMERLAAASESWAELPRAAATAAYPRSSSLRAATTA